MPLYHSLADSFRLDFYLPATHLATPPTITYAADRQLDAVMASSTPPQAVLMDVAADLTVCAPDGSPVAPLIECLRMLRRRAYPILRFTDEGVGAAIADLADRENLGDLTLCVPYRLRRLLPPVRAALPLSRGMLDCRGETLPDDLLACSGECQAHEATMLLLAAPPVRTELRRLQKRFLQVWAEADAAPAAAVTSGACGLLTANPAQLYALLARFPEGAVTRPTPLYAHKGLHITDEFPENTIKATVGAAEAGYDAAEIDISLTADDVIVVQHDPNTGRHFDRACQVVEMPYAELRQLRRLRFPEDGIDRFDEMICAMADYPETPLLIEIKPPAPTFGVEACVRLMRPLLARPDAQQNCTAIMGVIPPYLAYVHAHLPRLPLSHCTYSKDLPPDTTDGLNGSIYMLAEALKGTNGGYNPYLSQINAPFARLAHLRGITLFPWSYAFKPWETEQEGLCQAFAAGYDGLTSDWVTKFADLPIDLLPALPDHAAAGEVIRPAADLRFRTGECRPADTLSVILLDGALRPCTDGFTAERGELTLALACRASLPNGAPYTLVSAAKTIRFD